MEQRLVRFFSSLCIFGICAFGADVMRPILDSRGNETGSYNVNPNPLGDPWIITPLQVTPEIREKLDAIPDWKGAAGLAKTTALPRSVNHFEEPEFRPIFHQKGGSCSAASGVGYIYTWESNILTGVHGEERRSMYFYPFNFLNRGDQGAGIWWMDAWDILKSTGCVSEADWPSALGKETATDWADTYEAYHNANFAHVASYSRIRNPLQNLDQVKQWIYDHGKGDAKGGVLQFNASSEFGIQRIPSGSAEAGGSIATRFDGQNTEHAMTFAGYNDDVYIDENNKGALLLVNSWGRTWGDDGTVWVPYNLLESENEFYILEVVPHIPRLEFKITLRGYGKNGGSFTSGYSPDTDADRPAATRDYPGAFTGNSGTFTGEIGLDCAEFWEDFNDRNGLGTFFLQSRGEGTITSLSLMIYDSTGMTLLNEIESEQTDESVGTTMTVVIEDNIVGVDKTPAQTVSSAITFRRVANTCSVYLPFENNARITLMSINGRRITSFTGTGKKWNVLPAVPKSGIHMVEVHTGNQYLVRKLSMVQ